MGGENCMCPETPCPICHTQANPNLCSCGCSNTVGSLEFIRLHVESLEEQEQREATEQYNGEQEALEQIHREEMQEQHPSMCNCSECN